MLAYEIIGRCKEREEDCKTIFKDIVGQMTKKSNVIVIATDLILIIRNLERIIGHIENIAESVHFHRRCKNCKTSAADCRETESRQGK